MRISDWSSDVCSSDLTPRLSPEYTPADVQAWGKGSEFSVTTLWPRLADFSFRPVRKMDVPIVFLLGRHDYIVPSPVAADWFAQVEDPSKKLVWLEHSDRKNTRLNSSH